MASFRKIVSRGVAELVMSEEQKQTVDSRSLHPTLRVISDNPYRGIEVSELRELAVRGIDKPETLSHAEIKRICSEVQSRLARRDVRAGRDRSGSAMDCC